MAKRATATKKPKGNTETTSTPTITATVDSTPASEHLSRIRDAEKQVSRCEEALADHNRGTKELKADLASAQKRLRDEIHDNNMRLNFGGFNDDDHNTIDDE